MLEEWGINVKKHQEIKKEKEYKKEKYDLFGVMYSCITKKGNPSKKEIEKIPEYLFHNLLSNDPKTINLSFLLTVKDIPIYYQYKLVEKLLPKTYIKYPKKNKKEDELIEFISEYYNCNYQKAKIYKELMSEDEINFLKKEMEKIKGK